tara:strand:- start:693 stop:1283 length:591 start_codon:yes stop_codon:yes gene_type:complete
MKNLFNPLHALRSFGVLLLVGMSVSVSAEDFNYGWSLDFAVEPSETHIAGQAIADLNDELTHIALINCENGSLNSQQCQQVADSGGQFEMLVDANQDGEFERWSIGVGKLRNGEYAKVLLIQNDASGEFTQLLLVDSATPGFSALYFQQGIVMWGMCLSCDVLADIVWQQNTYQVSWNANPINSRAWSDELLVVDN